MFGSKKGKLAKLDKAYAKKLEQAMEAQRGGNMPRYATLTAEAEKILAQADALRQELEG